MSKRRLILMVIIVFFLFANFSMALTLEELNIKLPYSNGETWHPSCTYDGTDDCSTHGSGTVNRYALDFNYGSGSEDCGKDALAAASGRAEVHAGCLEKNYACNGGYGNYVDLFHGDGYVTRYAHLQEGSILVYENQWVLQGQPVGLVGNTGNSDYCHMHFAFYHYGLAAKPEPMSGYTNFTSYNPYTSDNNGYYMMQNWDNTCKNIDPNPLVERFRNPSTGKIEVNMTPMDNRIYFYTDNLCQIDYYAAYNIWEGEGGPLLVGDPGDTGISDGPDGNIKRVRAALGGTNSWQTFFTMQVGQRLDVEVGITNKGDEAISGGEVEAYASDNQTFNEAMDQRLNQESFGSLSPGSMITKHLRGAVMKDPGTFYIFAKVEAWGDQNGSNDLSRNDDPEEYARVTVLAAGDLFLKNQTITGAKYYEASSAIVAGENFVVSPTGNVTMRVPPGGKIHLKPGFRVQRGGRFHAIAE